LKDFFIRFLRPAFFKPQRERERERGGGGRQRKRILSTYACDVRADGRLRASGAMTL